MMRTERGVSCVTKWIATAVLAAWSSACGITERCTPGQMRDCMRSLEGGYAQNGYQTCDSRGTWSECLSVGACVAPGGTSLPVYSRCTTSDQCGPATCAVCSHYSGVQDPNGFSVCNVFCQVDSDCAPTTSSSDVAPRCVLGQCMLLCRSSSTCPQDSQCMPWNDTTSASMYPGFDGLCE
jgi:hypothetical protein